MMTRGGAEVRCVARFARNRRRFGRRRPHRPSARPAGHRALLHLAVPHRQPVPVRIAGLPRAARRTPSPRVFQGRQKHLRPLREPTCPAVGGTLRDLDRRPARLRRLWRLAPFTSAWSSTSGNVTASGSPTSSRARSRAPAATSPTSAAPYEDPADHYRTVVVPRRPHR